MKTQRAHSRRNAASGQRGVVLLFSLIALVILLIAAVGLVRSFKTSLFTSANIAYKRDLQNQGERAIDKVLVAFRPAGALASPLSRSVSNTAQHYSAVALPSNELGIPIALQTNALYAAVADGSKDVSAANDSSLVGMAVRIQYVVDRLCASAGDEQMLGSGSCVLANTPIPAGTALRTCRARIARRCAPRARRQRLRASSDRLSIKVSGPRGTNSFFQSTFTMPSST